MHNPETELAWAAGFYEGEGSVTLINGRPALQARNNDPEPLRRFATALGIGKVYGPYWDSSRRGKRKPFFHVIATGPPALDATILLAPWMSRRRLGRCSTCSPA